MTLILNNKKVLLFPLFGTITAPFSFYKREITATGEYILTLCAKLEQTLP
jgi:hypothetical protein